MDARDLFERLLQSGSELARKGRSFAEEKLDIPKEGEKREAMLSGLGKGALATGVLALLLGTRAGRGAAGGLLKLGSLAAIGGLAWKGYQKWQGGAESVKPIAELAGPEADRRSRLLLRAIIAAAKADGHIDEAEQQKIVALMERLDLDEDAFTLLQAELANPLDMAALAAEVDSPQIAAEVYMTSLLAVNSDQPEERRYLEELAQALGLEPDLVASLEDEAKNA